MKMYFWKQAWLMAALLPCLTAGQVQAATITADGDCTLADAITAANMDTATGSCISGDAGKDIIELTYSPLLPEEVAPDPTMTIIITDPIVPTDPIDPTDKKWLPQITTEILINGNGNTIDTQYYSSSGCVLRISSTGNLTLNEVTVTGGHQNSTDNGGGIHNEFGVVTLINSTVTRNQAAEYGGGIYSHGGSLTLINSTVSGNWVYQENGMEIYSYGGGIYGNDSSLTLTNSTVSKNWAFSGYGGGIYTISSTLNLTDSTISENEALLVGGIYSDSGSTSTLTNSIVSKNEACYGGGICASNSTLQLINSTVSENSAFLYDVGVNYGGGMIIGDSTVTLTNSTISGNEAINDGGGIFIVNSTLTLISSLISGNKSTAGAGNELYNVSEPSTIYANSSNLFGHRGESDTKAFFNFTPGNSDINATSDGTNGILKPTALSTILLPLADNGGPTQTHALPAGSPAIDLDTTCSAGLSTDQRGEPRPVTGCDTGSFEGSISLSSGTAFLPSLYLLLDH